TLYFAEGYTGPGFQQYLCIGNPGAAPASITLTCLFGGVPAEVKSYTVPARSRATIFINHEVGPDREVSLVLNSDQPVFAERPMYFSYHGAITDGHTASGVSLP
ncbi:MAG: hypothetical protein ACYC55_02750, partial [Candidatus Geothermincolia bacterium]